MMLPESRSGWIVALVDLLVIVGVVIAGQLSHGISPLSAPFDTIETLGPFVLGWILLVALLDLYREPRLQRTGTTLRFVVAAWLGAVAVGLVGRTSPYVDGDATWPFGLVIVGTVLVVLVPWRVIAARVLFGEERASHVGTPTN